jgi:hypothetical protein
VVSGRILYSIKIFVLWRLTLDIPVVMQCGSRLNDWCLSLARKKICEKPESFKEPEFLIGMGLCASEVVVTVNATSKNHDVSITLRASASAGIAKEILPLCAEARENGHLVDACTTLKRSPSEPDVLSSVCVARETCNGEKNAEAEEETTPRLEQPSPNTDQHERCKKIEESEDAIPMTAEDSNEDHHEEFKKIQEGAITPVEDSIDIAASDAQKRHIAIISELQTNYGKEVAYHKRDLIGKIQNVHKDCTWLDKDDQVITFRITVPTLLCNRQTWNGHYCMHISHSEVNLSNIIGEKRACFILYRQMYEMMAKTRIFAPFLFTFACPFYCKMPFKLQNEKAIYDAQAQTPAIVEAFLGDGPFQTFLDANGRYVSQNPSPRELWCGAFLHYTYCFLEGRGVVANIRGSAQGIHSCCLYTAPNIIRQCRESHMCNRFCFSLRLSPIESYDHVHRAQPPAFFSH